MPSPVEETIVPPPAGPIAIGLEPAHNALISMQALLLANKYSGLGDWVTRTASALAPEEWADHKLIFIGLYYTIVPSGSWPSFAAYIDHLASCDPSELRDRMLAKYAQFPPIGAEQEPGVGVEPPPVDWEQILQDADSYLAFLTERFGADRIVTEIETRAYSYVIDPPAMQTLIVSHLRGMWERYLADEWERVEPMLQDAVRAFQQVDFGTASKLEAAELILEDVAEDKEEWLRSRIEEYEHVTFVPSAHVGPYVLTICDDSALWIMFGARLPEGVQYHAPDLSRAEIVTRLNALADDSRLQILRLIADTGETRSQEIMEVLGLSQSAASRHLKQLTATGFLHARRCNGAKCYTLNRERVTNTLRAISAFLLSE